MSDRSSPAEIGAHPNPDGAGPTQDGDPAELLQDFLIEEFATVLLRTPVAAEEATTQVADAGHTGAEVDPAWLGWRTVIEPWNETLVAVCEEMPAGEAAPAAQRVEVDSDYYISSLFKNESTSDSECARRTPPHRFPPARKLGRERQAARRQCEHELRMRAVDFCRQARDDGWSTPESARVLGLPHRTLNDWSQRARTNDLQPRPRGRPPQITPPERREQVWSFLIHHGPSTSLATLKAENPDMSRANLIDISRDYRHAWNATHPKERCELDWLRPGSVWAMDFSHPPHLIDGYYSAILNVLDLASHQQLLWLALAHEDAVTVVEALEGLFEEHGRPLVLKCDNGPAFRSHVIKRLLTARRVFTLYSPPYCPSYNGGCERANRTLKGLTGHLAEQAGRSGYWRSEDLLEARLRANRFRRPWGATGPTPEENWSARPRISLDERESLWQHLKCEIAAQGDLRQVDLTAALSHYQQAEIERAAAEPVLESLGLLHITRRRITPVV